MITIFNHTNLQLIVQTLPDDQGGETISVELLRRNPSHPVPGNTTSLMSARGPHGGIAPHLQSFDVEGIFKIAGEQQSKHERMLSESLTQASDVLKTFLSSLDLADDDDPDVVLTEIARLKACEADLRSIQETERDQARKIRKLLSFIAQTGANNAMLRARLELLED